MLEGEAVAQIRGALIAALRRTGGDLQEAVEPGLDTGTSEHEAQLRAALSCSIRPATRAAARRAQLLDQTG
jgi:hypothetical protein